jgi:hypothetical protein
MSLVREKESLESLIYRIKTGNICENIFLVVVTAG